MKLFWMWTQITYLPGGKGIYKRARNVGLCVNKSEQRNLYFWMDSDSWIQHNWEQFFLLKEKFLKQCLWSIVFFSLLVLDQALNLCQGWHDINKTVLALWMQRNNQQMCESVKIVSPPPTLSWPNPITA